MRGGLRVGAVRARVDPVHQEELDRKASLAQAKELIAALESLKYTEEQAQDNEFDLKECIICMEEFRLGEAILRIPLCRHFFHQQCAKKWFESKNQAREKKCPLCNKPLDIEEIKSMKK